jgi:outer membrane protein
MKLIISLTLSLIILLLSAQFAIAKKGDVLIRLRAATVIPDEKSDLYNQTESSTGLASTLYGDSSAKLSIDNNVIPEIDFSYYITNNIAAELILSTGTKHNVKIESITSSNNPNLGSIDILPPTLTFQWHFNPDHQFDPYLGVGATYARVMNNRLDLCCNNNLPIHVEKNNFGPAVQIGLDYNLDETYSLNFDVKKSWLEMDVKTGESLIDKLNVDPWVVSLGVGMRF